MKEAEIYALCAVKHKSDLLFMGLQPHRSQMLGAIGGGRGQGVNLLSCEAPAPFLDNRQDEESDTGKRVLCVFNRQRGREKATRNYRPIYYVGVVEDKAPKDVYARMLMQCSMGCGHWGREGATCDEAFSD